jgi:hypothetical protein
LDAVHFLHPLPLGRALPWCRAANATLAVNENRATEERYRPGVWEECEGLGKYNSKKNKIKGRT